MVLGDGVSRAARCKPLISAERRSSPRPDSLGTPVQAQQAGEGFTSDEIIGNAMLLLLAGHVAVRNLIGNVLYLLLTHPEQWAALKADPALLPGAIEETLRYEPPVTMIPCRATEGFAWHAKPHTSPTARALKSRALQHHI
jgi:cytochrome P450